MEEAGDEECREGFFEEASLEGFFEEVVWKKPAKKPVLKEGCSIIMDVGGVPSNDRHNGIFTCETFSKDFPEAPTKHRGKVRETKIGCPCRQRSERWAVTVRLSS